MALDQTSFMDDPVLHVMYGYPPWTSSGRTYIEIYMLSNILRTRIGNIYKHGSIAQLVERWTKNRLTALVVGSIPGVVSLSKKAKNFLISVENVPVQFSKSQP